MISEETLKQWGAAPSQTEQDKMGNAERAIRKAIASNEVLSKMDISIFPQGSYKSKTNVKQDSDVDICVCLNSTFFTRYPPGKSDEYYGNSDGSIRFNHFKDLIQEALEFYFGKYNVDRGNKAFDIDSNSYRVDADVVPAFAYRYYYDTGYNWHKPEGICFFADDGQKIINWPEQVYSNCLAKHERTGRRYRKMARIIKRLRNQMQSVGISSAKDIPSFLIQSMVWSAPDSCFNHTTYDEDITKVLSFCISKTSDDTAASKLKEVNDIKKIFGSHQPCGREQVNTFFSEAWDYLFY